MNTMSRPSAPTKVSRQAARTVAAGAALVAAGLYLLIGFGVVSVGTDASGSTPDLLPFGLMAGATFAAAAGLIAWSDSKVVSIGVAIWSLLVIVAYIAFSGLRTPPFETWGLAVKLAQLVVFGATLYLTTSGSEPAEPRPVMGATRDRDGDDRHPQASPSANGRQTGAHIGVWSGLGAAIGLLAAPMLAAEAPLAIVAGAAIGVLVGLVIDTVTASNFRR